MNLCYAGTDVLVLRGSFIPRVVRRGLRVSYEHLSVDAGVDHLLLWLPDASGYAAASSEEESVRLLSEVVERRVAETTLVLLGSKTNWNDNAQSPMLWNLLYQSWRAHPGSIDDLVVGDGHVSVGSFADFDTAFCTVPTNDVSTYHSQSKPVLRGRTMSGSAF